MSEPPRTPPESKEDASTLEAGPTDVSADPSITDDNLVWWDEPADQDPLNPMNWSEKKKWANIAVLSAMTFVTPLASSMFAPGVPEVLHDFKSKSQTLAEFVVSVYILGFAFGPLVIAPLSEMYGRVKVYNVSNVLFTVFNLACSFSPNMDALIVFRFFAGCFGSAPVTIGGGTIADMMPIERRASSMAIWALGPLVGPVVGPVAGGYLVEAMGWRFVFRLLAILSGVMAILAFFCMRESYAPVLLERKAQRLRQETGNQNLRSKLDTGLTKKELLRRSIIRPTKMLLFSPIVLLFSTFIGFVYGVLYLLFTTFTFVFQGEYGFTSGNAGLTFLGIGIGMIIGLVVIGALSDRIIKAVQARGETPKPEHRIPLHLTLPGSLCIPLGLFIYGWTAYYRVHWIVPIIGTFFVGLGIMAVFMTISVYLVDAFVQYAASAMAASTVLRSIFGAVLPLAGLDLYNALGLGWGNSLLAFIALAMVPVTVLFAKYGEKIRTHPRFQLNL